MQGEGEQKGEGVKGTRRGKGRRRRREKGRRRWKGRRGEGKGEEEGWDISTHRQVQTFCSSEMTLPCTNMNLQQVQINVIVK